MVFNFIDSYYNFNIYRNSCFFANLLGFEITSNFIFFILIGLVIIISFSFSLSISKINKRILLLTQIVAIDEWSKRNGKEVDYENKKIEYLIIGAGVTGLTFANYCNDDYLIVEKENEVGGYCRTIYSKDYVWDFAGHFFHFKTDEFKQLFLNNISKKT